jgi:TetR/AcrR family transcriptional repressor of nem operon
MLRERGFDAASIAEVMHAAGMTHGGFYKHFESKNDLLRAAVRSSFDEVVDRFDRRKAKSGHDAAVAAYVREYLSSRHVAEPGRGCPVAALGADAGRQSDSFGSEFATGVEKLIERIGRVKNAKGDATAARSTAIRALAQMVGAVVVARAVGEISLRDEVLTACAEATPGR